MQGTEFKNIPWLFGEKKTAKMNPLIQLKTSSQLQNPRRLPDF